MGVTSSDLHCIMTVHFCAILNHHEILSRRDEQEQSRTMIKVDKWKILLSRIHASS
jgi:hypothetical protein